ncbi:MAG: MBOAT family protein [bacterium]|nr:MBOAT family protein [bacterium]
MSVLFYAWGEPAFVWVVLLSVIVNWALGCGISGKHGKLCTVLALVYDIVLLVTFKYLAFFVNSIGILFHKDFRELQIALPIGISFFTFQMISYILDVRMGKTEAQKSLINVGLYILMFPQMIAGPIVRYGMVADEILHRRENVEDFINGVQRFSFGLAKKVLIANYMGMLADAVFNCTEAVRVSALTAWLGAIAYMLQIYFDFSGYSDMAIGLGRMFAFHFPENFRYPYAAKTVTDFWRRWHISLSGWFRDYVYIPLGGNRVTKGEWVRNLFVVWMLTGIWHGADWSFVLWGLGYFVLLLFEKLAGMDKKGNAVTRIVTLLLVMFLWVLFRADGIGSAVHYFSWMFGGGNGKLWDATTFAYLNSAKIILTAAVIGAMPLSSLIYARLPMKETTKNSIRGAAALVLMLLSVCVCVQASYNPFIYFNF